MVTRKLTGQMVINDMQPIVMPVGYRSADAKKQNRLLGASRRVDHLHTRRTRIPAAAAGSDGFRAARRNNAPEKAAGFRTNG